MTETKYVRRDGTCGLNNLVFDDQGELYAKLLLSSLNAEASAVSLFVGSQISFWFLYIILDSLAAICCDRDDILLFACIFLP